MKQNYQKLKAFTVVEALVVLTVSSLLIALVFVFYNNLQRNYTGVERELETLDNLLGSYQLLALMFDKSETIRLLDEGKLVFNYSNGLSKVVEFDPNVQRMMVEATPGELVKLLYDEYQVYTMPNSSYVQSLELFLDTAGNSLFLLKEYLPYERIVINGAVKTLNNGN